MQAGPGFSNQRLLLQCHGCRRFLREVNRLLAQVAMTTGGSAARSRPSSCRPLCLHRQTCWSCNMELGPQLYHCAEFKNTWNHWRNCEKECPKIDLKGHKEETSCKRGPASQINASFSNVTDVGVFRVRLIGFLAQAAMKTEVLLRALGRVRATPCACIVRRVGHATWNWGPNCITVQSSRTHGTIGGTVRKNVPK